MKKFIVATAISISSQIFAATTSIQVLRTDRLVYINNELAGVYAVCVRPGSQDYYFSNEFYNDVRVQRSDQILECDGQSYWKPLISFVANGATGTLSGAAKPSDYVREADAVTNEQTNFSVDWPPGSLSSASVFQHQVGLWRDPAGGVNTTLNLSGKQYSPAGLFAVDGYLSSQNGRFQGYLSDASWKRNYPQLGLSSRVGVNTFSSSGTSTTLYGAVLGTNDDAVLANTTQTLDGFADVPGRLQIRSGGTLVREVPVSAGFFQIPAVGLPVTGGAMGQYTLTLIDNAGRVVRTWDAFVPVGTNLLRPGGNNWRIFAGQIEGSLTRTSMLSGPRNLGGGFVYRRGLTSTLTAEISALLAEHVRGAGTSADFVPASWISFSGGATKYWGNVLPSTAFVYTDLHSTYAGANVGYTSQDCNSQYYGSKVGNRCQNLRTSIYLAYAPLGRLTVLRTATIGASPRAESLGLNWATPNFGRVSLSVYGTRQAYEGSASYSAGILATISLNRGTMTDGATFTGNTSTYTSSYTVTDTRDNQYTLGADVTHNATNTTGDLRASVQHSAWHGIYQGNSVVTNRGDVTLGVTETGALVMSDGVITPTRISDQGYAIVHLQDLPNVTLEDGIGVSRAVTNHDGYAVLPAARDGLQDLRVAPEDIPDGLNVRSALVGKVSDDWSAMLWTPSVRHVNHGWIRLMRPNGDPLPMGSMLRFGDEEPDFVLGHGELFASDLPIDPRDIEVRMPGDTSRCTVHFPGSIKLQQNYASDMPEFVCVSPLQKDKSQ
ncbi:hypothetical protein [Burkholderia territorii]|uniref:hypothetical protein n=1 Tax=Burkholderia territorii TaxID=1503055 RepID=UPI000AF1B392|nr:hypothetical protein [Burkholderia territorii]